jgi:hypothetical protein
MMKWVYAAYGFLGMALLFAGLMLFLRFAETEPDRPTAADDSGPAAGRGSGRPGKLVIAYAGDLMGDLDPCG